MNEKSKKKGSSSVTPNSCCSSRGRFWEPFPHIISTCNLQYSLGTSESLISFLSQGTAIFTSHPLSSPDDIIIVSDDKNFF